MTVGKKPPVQARPAVMPGTIVVQQQAANAIQTLLSQGAPVKTRPHVAPRPGTKGTTMSSSKTKAVDADIAEFYFRIDLAINPPLPDSKAKAAKNDFFALKQKKDEDVKLVNGEIVVVSNNVTSIEQSNSPSDYVYNYSDFKKALTSVAALATGAGSSIDGQVVIRDASTQRFYRLKVDAGNITAEAANLGWPDGTQTPFPESGGA